MVRSMGIQVKLVKISCEVWFVLTGTSRIFKEWSANGLRVIGEWAVF
jgi:hypothetical protein